MQLSFAFHKYTLIDKKTGIGGQTEVNPESSSLPR